MSLLELLLVTHSWTMSLLEHCTSTMYTMCKLYKQNKHNANLTMSPPLEPHAPQLENQAPWQATVVLVLVAIVVAVVTKAEVVVAVVVAVVPTVVVVAVVAKTRHHVQGRHFNFL